MSNNSTNPIRVGIAGLGRSGWGIHAHSVSEVRWDDAWHLLDASLLNYFPKADGKIASVAEITAAVTDWYAKNPGFKGNDAKLRELHRSDGWTGWKRGPDLLTRSPHISKGGWWLAGDQRWHSNASLRAQVEGATLDGISTRYLTAERMRASLAFGTDQLTSVHRDVNTLTSSVVYEYYVQGWEKYF